MLWESCILQPALRSNEYFGTNSKSVWDSNQFGLLPLLRIWAAVMFRLLQQHHFIVSNIYNIEVDCFFCSNLILFYKSWLRELRSMFASDFYFYEPIKHLFIFGKICALVQAHRSRDSIDFSSLHFNERLLWLLLWVSPLYFHLK